MDAFLLLEARFVRFIDDDRVVFVEVGVGLGLHQEYPVGHELYVDVAIRPVFESHLVPHRCPQGLLQLGGNPAGHGDRRDPARLGASDDPVDSPPRLQTHLRNLSGFPRTRLPRDDHYLMGAYGLDDVGFPPHDGEGVGVGESGYPFTTLPFPCRRLCDLFVETCQAGADLFL